MAKELELRVPCLFCGKRLSKEDKKVHKCWAKGDSMTEETREQMNHDDQPEDPNGGDGSDD